MPAQDRTDENEGWLLQPRTEPSLSKRPRQPLAVLAKQTPLGSGQDAKPLSAPLAIGVKRKAALEEEADEETAETRNRKEEAKHSPNFNYEPASLTVPKLSELARSDIEALNLTPAFGYTVDEWGLRHGSPQPSAGCTQPFYRQQAFPRLTKLDLTRVEIGDNDLRYLIRLPALLALGLSATAISDRGLKYLAQHAAWASRLQCLKVAQVERVTDEALVWLAHFESLACLDLSGTRVTLGGLLSPQARLLNLPLLTDLRLGSSLGDRVAALRQAIPSDLPASTPSSSSCNYWLQRLQPFEAILRGNPGDFLPLLAKMTPEPRQRLALLLRLARSVARLHSLCK